MTRKRRPVDRLAVSYSKHHFNPPELLDYIILDGFAKEWQEMGLGEEDFKALRLLIALAGTRPPIVPGTGGLRKLRFAPVGSNKGKRGGARICYAIFPTASVVLLIKAYPKSKKENLSATEKNAIRKELAAFERRLEEGPIN